MDRAKTAAELEEVREESEDGLLHPEDVVRWAGERPDSELHGQFEWDDSVAGVAWRVEQARAIIRVVVVREVVPERVVRMYVSTPSDRANGGGYRPTAEALEDGRAELIADALRRVRNLRHQYTHLPELDQLFAEIDAAAGKFLKAKVKAVK